MLYSGELIEEIRIQNEIVSIISSYVLLKQRGSNHFGLCPFHSEHSPSFSVSADKQMYHCFGCGVSGNVITFIMKIENYDFLDAIKFLANRARITLPEPNFSQETKKAAELKEQLFSINKAAARLYFNFLQSESGNQAKEYFNKRGIDIKTQRSFGLGYAPQYSQMYNRLLEFGFTQEAIESSGLVIKNKNGNGYYERFFNRIMFPIIDVAGRIVGFGGRIMDKGGPKYLNSPDTILFNKGRCLYGINFARTFRQNIIIVEGYMDVISLHKAGFKNTVAALGTSFGDEHARLLRKYTDNVTILFDSDDAGQKAVRRAITVLTAVGFKPNVLKVSNAKDPDEYIKKFGAEAFAKLLESSVNYVSYQINSIKEKNDISDTQQKINFATESVDVLSRVLNPIEREAYIKEVSQMSDISEESIKEEVDSIVNKQEKVISMEAIKKVNTNKFLYRKNTSETKDIPISLILAEKELLNLIASDKNIFDKIKKHLQPENFSDKDYKDVAEFIYKKHNANSVIYPAEIANNFETVEQQQKVSEIFTLQHDLYDSNLDKIVLDQIKIIKKFYYEYAIRQEQDFEQKIHLISEKRELEALITL